MDSQSRAFESTAKVRLGLMNPYTLIGSRLGIIELPRWQRLAARHDAVVRHERRLRAGRTDDGCDENCAHNVARAYRPADTSTWTLTITDRAGSAARPTVSGRRQTSFLRISGGRTAEAKRGVAM